jgi:hypothetical protein
MRSSISSVLRPAAAAASVLMGVVGGPFYLEPAAHAAQLREAAVTPAASTVLKRLPAGRDELVFRGENANRSWLVYLTPAEADRASSFQLAMLNAVVALPDRSSLKLTINGHVLSTVPIRSPDKVTTVNVKIPAGVLNPGANRVQMDVALTHRVDCSLKATYELWTLLDPAKTGIVMDSRAAYSIRSLDEIAAEPLAEDGTTRIHLRTPDNADADAVGRAGRLIDALVRRARLFRPVVDVGPNAGQGPGFDVVLTDGPSRNDSLADLRVFSRADGVTLGRDSATDRLVVIVSGASGADLDARISSLEKDAPKAGAAQASTDGVQITAGARKTFAELGFGTENFDGRHYLSTASITLPSDFFGASYDSGRLLIDGGHSATLDPNSELIFRVNGAIVSTIWLSAGKPEQFVHRVVELPLRFFHPGHNEIAIEGLTASPLDRQCDVAASLRDTRLLIAGTSELQFPDFAHLVTLPQIPSALAGAASPEQGARLHLYLPDLERGSVATALTILANMTSTAGRMENPVVHLEAPEVGAIPGVAIAPLGDLPESLATPLRKIITSSDDAPASGDATPNSNPQTDASEAAVRAPVATDVSFNLDLGAVVEAGQGLLGKHGFFFSSGEREADALALSANSLLIGAVNPSSAAQTVGGVDIPQIIHDPAQWLVVTAQSSGAYEAGVERLVADGKWADLAGRAVSFDPEKNQLRSVQPERVAYVMPNHFVLGDVRPILGGILSDNISLSSGALMLLMSILGVSTHALVRRMGAR